MNASKVLLQIGRNRLLWRLFVGLLVGRGLEGITDGSTVGLVLESKPFPTQQYSKIIKTTKPDPIFDETDIGMHSVTYSA